MKAINLLIFMGAGLILPAFVFAYAPGGYTNCNDAKKAVCVPLKLDPMHCACVSYGVGESVKAETMDDAVHIRIGSKNPVVKVTLTLNELMTRVDAYCVEPYCVGYVYINYTKSGWFKHKWLCSNDGDSSADNVTVSFTETNGKLACDVAKE